MITVVLDTNALMLPVERDVRLFEELDRVLSESYVSLVPRPVVAELNRLSDGAGVEATAASVGSDLLDRCCIVDTEADFADDAVVELATTEIILRHTAIRADTDTDAATVDNSLTDQTDEKDIGTHTNVHNNTDTSGQITVEANAHAQAQVADTDTNMNVDVIVIETSDAESTAEATTQTATDEHSATEHYVVTEDRPLRNRLYNYDVRVIGIRGRNTLEITEP